MSRTVQQVRRTSEGTQTGSPDWESGLMEPMNLLVARKAVADDMRHQVSLAGSGEARRTTRITRHRVGRTTRITRQRVSDLFRRALTTHSRTA